MQTLKTKSAVQLNNCCLTLNVLFQSKITSVFDLTFKTIKLSINENVKIQSENKNYLVQTINKNSTQSCIPFTESRISTKTLEHLCMYVLNFLYLFFVLDFIFVLYKKILFDLELNFILIYFVTYFLYFVSYNNHFPDI